VYIDSCDEKEKSEGVGESDREGAGGLLRRQYSVVVGRLCHSDTVELTVKICHDIDAARLTLTSNARNCYCAWVEVSRHLDTEA
jgi:hypothetical protein